MGCSAFLGGISKNYKTNYLVDKESKYVVVEADEFDRSFLKLNPQKAIITAIDADHLDIYSDENDLRETFKQFLYQINTGGKIQINSKIKLKIQTRKDNEDSHTSLNEKTKVEKKSRRLSLCFDNSKRLMSSYCLPNKLIEIK